MVSRKPVPSLGAPTSAPYPTTPSSADPPSFEAPSGLPSVASEPEIDNAWSEEGLPKQNLKSVSREDLPESLRVGPHGHLPSTSQEPPRVLKHTNPYMSRTNTGSSNGESSAEAWGKPTQPSNAPPPPPVPKGWVTEDGPNATANNSADTPPPTHQLSNLNHSEPSTNPWQPALDERHPLKSHPIPSPQTEDSGNDVWSAPGRQAPNLPPADTSKPALIDLEEQESPAWDEVEASPVVHEMPADNAVEAHQIQRDQHAWDESDGHPARKTTFVAEDPTQQGEGWNLIDHDPAPTAQESGVIGGDGTVLDRFEEAPALPPRRSQENPPAQPPRPEASGSSTVTPAEEAKKQKKETYEIKKVSWYDINATENPRVSPILVQNANGPCPLLALVNALTFSTPAGVETALVETLRLREQVSLGLLLDAVFDELMSGRRGDAAQELPDVSDLYAFLITLHTGMNVNPRFFPLPPTKSPKDPRNSMSHVHPSDREENLPGAFEETREMKLYSTFSIPLIHGWLPAKDSPEYSALLRSAKTYEDAQNLMFHEEELEDKLQREGLSFEEQGMLGDIATIKAFFSSSATQLTDYGLDAITTSLAPGAVAILFRNDHFSTLYRHPETLQLLQLVTDMGYAGHEEVVWESLIDINGENADFFSGDFRLVSGGPATPAAEPSSNQGWTTVQGRRQQSSSQTPAQNEPPNSPSATEQEDHDLALALQLQEEEEERHRSELARRRRETELSQQYIEQQGSSPASNGSGGANIPVSRRGGGRRVSSTPQQPPRNQAQADLRPAIPPRRNNVNTQNPPQAADPEAGVDVPPPSYDVAAGQAAYVPPDGHPSHASANPMGPAPGIGRGRGVRRQTGGLVDQDPGQPIGLGRRNTGSQQVGSGERERDCVVM